MEIRLKIDRLWLEVEKHSMEKLLRRYKQWEAATLERAKKAKDLRSLRELYYELGERWEWDQVTGEWLSKGKPLDAVSFIMRVPGLEPGKTRYVIYAVMAYSKGFTDQFDHLGDKERVILERDDATGKIVVWSTTGHGALDLHPTDLSEFGTLENIVKKCHLVAQPGDHALRLSLPLEISRGWNLQQRLWMIASGNTEFTWRTITVVCPEDLEASLDFRFHRYANSVISLERVWKKLGSDPSFVGRSLPPELRSRNKASLRKVEGLLHILWFKPPAHQLRPAQAVYDEFKNIPDPTELETTLIPYLSELVFALNDVIEKAKYLKWKSVVEQKGYTPESLFDKINITGMAREALVVALDDILKEHTLAYIAYPERATMVGKILRIVLGLLVLPVRIGAAFTTTLSCWFKDKILSRLRFRSSEEPSSEETVEPIDSVHTA